MEVPLPRVLYAECPERLNAYLNITGKGNSEGEIKWLRRAGRMVVQQVLE